MLLKRYLVLAAGVLLFIIGFIGYFTVTNAQMEERFREERVKYGVQGTVLTASDSGSSTTEPAPSTPAVTAPATTTPASAAANTDGAPIPPTTPATSAPADSTTPSPSGAPDANMLIGPVAPPSSSTPDNTTNPAPPAPTDTNSAPIAPSSTMNDSRGHGSPFLVLAAYHPSDGMQIQTPGFEPPRGSLVTPAAPPLTVSAPSTNTGVANATNTGTSPSPATNAAPVTATSAGPARPVPVEASVIVLLYHQFVAPGVKVSQKLQWTMDQGVFESEMKYIHDNGYHVVPMSDLLKFLKHQIGLPPNSVVITIDDGYKSAIVYAAPILKQYGFPWTFFVYPDFITVNESKGAASWNDLLALQADGVDIESHSMTHPTLTKHSQKIKGVWHSLSPAEYDQWLTNETLGAKTLLEQKMGKPIICFAYPFGAYNKEVEAKVIAAGYEAIFTVAGNPVHATTDPHSIGRYTITQGEEKFFISDLHQGALGVAEADPAPGVTITNPRPIITAVLGYAGNLDPNSIEAEVRDFGSVHHDYDPKTSTIRLYLPRDLVQSVYSVTIRVKDAETGQTMAASWRFNYEPAGATNAVHAPIAPTTATNAASASPLTNAAPSTNAPPAVQNTTVVKSAAIVKALPSEASKATAR